MAKKQVQTRNTQPSEYTVEPGETLEIIARHRYGAQAMWPHLLLANQDLITRPQDLKPGMTLVVPVPEPPIHVVGVGETLGTIASKWYGAARMFEQILAANRDRIDDARRLHPGTLLRIPLIDDEEEKLKVG